MPTTSDFRLTNNVREDQTQKAGYKPQRRLRESCPLILGEETRNERHHSERRPQDQARAASLQERPPEINRNGGQSYEGKRREAGHRPGNDQRPFRLMRMAPLQGGDREPIERGEREQVKNNERKVPARDVLRRPTSSFSMRYQPGLATSSVAKPTDATRSSQRTRVHCESVKGPIDGDAVAVESDGHHEEFSDK